ncbi:MoaD family protein [Alkalibacter mobilis]|uniref:MoaD family protein n=1 Tax=Alkalibacter mobilis TaxID=2787712 RepID=UPI00189F8390|nr:MoaD family protein [Alkalibacter mobilis]MBF7096664.1 MoaD family protein [Alkalibacter mobilis]
MSEIEITVKTIYSFEKYLGGKKSQKILLKSDSTVMDIIDILTSVYGKTLRDKLIQDGRPARGMVYLLNGRTIMALDGLETKVDDGDEFIVMPPVGGG